jgi:hypothetical protein
MKNTIELNTYLTGTNADKVRPIQINALSTERAIIRRAKSVHGVSHYRHIVKRFTGNFNGAEYITLSFPGLSLGLTIDLNGGQDEY